MMTMAIGQTTRTERAAVVAHMRLCEQCRKAVIRRVAEMAVGMPLAAFAQTIAASVEMVEADFKDPEFASVAEPPRT